MTVTPALTYYLDPAVKAHGVTFDAPRMGDAGFDLRAAENLLVPAGEQVLVPTGLFLAIPQGWVGIVKDRSSMAMKRLYTHAGVIDASYRGEVKLVLSNHGRESFHIERGQKLAQMLLVPVSTQCVEAVSQESLGTTQRGSGGFGSTGS